MGQRHQAFLIARVRARGATDATYRCVAAYHHQWCYGTLPVEAARRFITLIKQPDNADVIREELLALDGKYGAPGASPRIPDVPCRFLLTILGNSWDAYAEEIVQVSGTCLENSTLSADMGCWEGGNDDGITVIDVTDPYDPAVSFFARYNTTPRTASGYIGKYYPGEIEAYANKLRNGETAAPEEPASEKEKNLAVWRKTLYDLAESFHHVRNVAYWMYAEAWPVGESGGGEAAKKEADPIPETQVPSLVDMALREALVHAIETEDIDALVDMVWLDDKLSIVEQVLRGYPVFHDVAVPLLVKLIQWWKRNNVSSIDLSGFNLSDDQLKATLPELEGIRSVNLSRNPSLTICSVESLLDQLPDLRRLLLFGCSGIADDDVYHLARATTKLLHHLDVLWHPAFMTGRLQAPPAFSIICREGLRYQSSFPGSSIAVATPSTIAQTLIDLWEFLWKGRELSISIGRICEVAWSMPRTENSWDERGILCQFNEPPWSSGEITEGWLVFIDIGDGRAVSRRWAFVRYSPPAEYDPAPQNEGERSARRYSPKFGVTSVHGFEEFLAKLEDEGRPSVEPGVLSRLRALVERLGIQTIPEEHVPESFGLRQPLEVSFP